jgi:hypothetical protein
MDHNLSKSNTFAEQRWSAREPRLALKDAAPSAVESSRSDNEWLKTFRRRTMSGRGRFKQITIKGAASMSSNRRLVAAFAAVASTVIAPMSHGAAPQTTTAFICTNLVSHASWRIIVDFQRHAVGSSPARISDAKISWHDRTDGGNYTLDRKSGDLTVVLASSTGGYELHDHCKPQR